MTSSGVSAGWQPHRHRPVAVARQDQRRQASL